MCVGFAFNGSIACGMKTFLEILVLMIVLHYFYVWMLFWSKLMRLDRVSYYQRIVDAIFDRS